MNVFTANRVDAIIIKAINENEEVVFAAGKVRKSLQTQLLCIVRAIVFAVVGFFLKKKHNQEDKFSMFKYRQAPF